MKQQNITLTLKFRTASVGSLCGETRYVNRVGNWNKNTFAVKLSITGHGQQVLGYFDDENNARRFADMAVLFFKDHRRRGELLFNNSQSQAQFDLDNEPDFKLVLESISSRLGLNKKTPLTPIVLSPPSSEFLKIEQQIKDILCRIDEQHKEISARLDALELKTAPIHVYDNIEKSITTQPVKINVDAATVLWPFTNEQEKKEN